jgi:hypothetical protein
LPGLADAPGHADAPGQPTHADGGAVGMSGAPGTRCPAGAEADPRGDDRKKCKCKGKGKGRGRGDGDGWGLGVCWGGAVVEWGAVGPMRGRPAAFGGGHFDVWR